MVVDRAFTNFEGDLVDAIEENLPAFDFGTDDANDRAWAITRAFAWQIWSEMNRTEPPTEPEP